MSSQAISAAGKLKRIREAYIKQLPSQLETIRTSLAGLGRGSEAGTALEELHRRIHTLKGASASFGLSSLSAVAAAGENMAKEAMLAGKPLDREWQRQMFEHLALMEREAASIDPSQGMDLQAMDLMVVAESSVTRERKLIYICEDDSFQRLTLTTQIGCFGFDVVSFGELEQLQNAVRNSPPDAIVMDLIFPGRPMGGAETISEIQSTFQSPIPTIFISTQDDLTCRLSAVRAGSSAYFVKPLNVSDLCSSLCTLTSTEKPEPYRVMIVDDDPYLSKLFSTILQNAGMETLALNDPLEAMAPLSEFKPDLILMDMHMPGCNGMELASAIRQYDNYFSIPIVFLSSETDTDIQFHAMRMGGDEFLTKPIKPEHLISAVAVRAERMKIIRSFMVRDSMTGLLNHTATKEQLDIAIAQARRSKEEVCFAMIDVDLFKQVNDSYGHPTGDRVLITLAGLLRQRLRKTDVVGRYGGEEFAVILPCCDISEAVTLLDQLRESFAGIRFPVGEDDFSSTFSCGVAPLSHRSDAAALCKAADEALYTAKREGRNRVVVAKGE